MYITKEVSIEGTEQEFITAFINEFTSANSNIVCNTDIANEFADTGNTPNILLHIAGMGVLQLTRSKPLSDGSASYTFSLFVNNVVKASASISFNNNPASSKYDSITTRTYKFVMHTQEDFQIIKLSDYNKSVYDTYSLCFVSINNEGMNLCMPQAISSNKFSLSNNFIRIDSTAKGTTGKLATRIPYRNYDGSVEIIKNKVLVVNDVYYYTTSAFYDCSYVSKNSVVTIDGANYIALDEHTLAKM